MPGECSKGSSAATTRRPRGRAIQATVPRLGEGEVATYSCPGCWLPRMLQRTRMRRRPAATKSERGGRRGGSAPATTEGGGQRRLETQQLLPAATPAPPRHGAVQNDASAANGGGSAVTHHNCEALGQGLCETSSHPGVWLRCIYMIFREGNINKLQYMLFRLNDFS